MDFFCEYGDELEGIPSRQKPAGLMYIAEKVDMSSECHVKLKLVKEDGTVAEKAEVAAPTNLIFENHVVTN